MPAPGKSTRVQTLTFDQPGDVWLEQGAYCDRDDNQDPGCIFSEDVRKRLLARLDRNFLLACSNYKAALAELKIEELLKKDDDLHWIISMALDLAGGHLVKSAAKALASLKAGGVARLTAGMQGAYMSDRSWQSRAEAVLASVSDKSIESVVKSSFDVAKKGYNKELQTRQNHEQAREKRGSIAFIEQLEKECDRRFVRLLNTAQATATDVVLKALYDSTDPVKTDEHTKAAYKAVLGAKLERFRRSGVGNIGRQRADDPVFPGHTVMRDTRVVWVQDAATGSKTLWYQRQHGDDNPGTIRPGDPGWDSFPGHAGPYKFGPHSPRDRATLDRPVPAEFVDAAIARSEQQWGPTPTIASPGFEYFKRFLPPEAHNVARPADLHAPEPMPLPRLDLSRSTPRSVDVDWASLPDAFKTTRISDS